MYQKRVFFKIAIYIVINNDLENLSRFSGFWKPATLSELGKQSVQPLWIPIENA